MGDFGPRRDYGRVRERSYRAGGYDREKRLQVTLGVGAAILLIGGCGIGFALGRATAPKPVTPVTDSAAITEETTLPVDALDEVPTESVDATFTDDVLLSEEATEDTEPPTKPKQLSPANGAVLTTARVYLRWSKSKDDSGSVTYSFEIQDRLSNGTYGRTQVIKGLKARSYSARVLPVRRRWRVWAVDEAGNKSAKSPWRTYIKKYVPPPKKSTNTTDTKSDETT